MTPDYTTREPVLSKRARWFRWLLIVALASYCIGWVALKWSPKYSLMMP